MPTGTAAGSRDMEAGAYRYQRHQPENNLLYRIVERYYPEFAAYLAEQGVILPRYIYNVNSKPTLNAVAWNMASCACDVNNCHAEHLVAFSCKCRGFCPGCGARRMAESAALLTDEVLPELPLRQWVLSVPFTLRFLFASRPAIMGRVLGIVYRAIATHLIHKAGYTRKTAHTGAVTLIQHFGSALNLNIHFHMLFLDGVYVIGRQCCMRPFPPVHSDHHYAPNMHSINVWCLAVIWNLSHIKQLILMAAIGDKQQQY